MRLSLFDFNFDSIESQNINKKYLPGRKTMTKLCDENQLKVNKENQENQFCNKPLFHMNITRVISKWILLQIAKNNLFIIVMVVNVETFLHTYIIPLKINVICN